MILKTFFKRFSQLIIKLMTYFSKLNKLVCIFKCGYRNIKHNTFSTDVTFKMF